MEGNRFHCIRERNVWRKRPISLESILPFDRFLRELRVCGIGDDEMSKAEGFCKPQYYDNRELSWLKFEQRVLNEAKDKNIPILDRLKFVSITSSNLDGFFYGARCIFKRHGTC